MANGRLPLWLVCSFAVSRIIGGCGRERGEPQPYSGKDVPSGARLALVARAPLARRSNPGSKCIGAGRVCYVATRQSG